MTEAESKCVERFNPVHFAQVHSYLQQSGCRVGLLINFHTTWLSRDGIRRIVNHFTDP
jgi:GxxExxY protein